jgi:hypothetical protein
MLAASIIRLKHHLDDGTENTSEASVNLYQTTQRNITEDSHLDANKFRLSEDSKSGINPKLQT